MSGSALHEFFGMSALTCYDFSYNPEKATVVTEDMEKDLWEKGVLGDSNPQKLLDTVIYTLGVQLALRASEHRSLNRNMFTVSLQLKY